MLLIVLLGVAVIFDLYTSGEFLFFEPLRIPAGELKTSHDFLAITSDLGRSGSLVLLYNLDL